MKRIFLIFSLTLIANVAASQNAFYDALYLNMISQDDLEKISSDSAFHLSKAEMASLKNLKIFLESPFNSVELQADSLDIDLFKKTVYRYNAYLIEKKSDLSDIFNGLQATSSITSAASILSLIPTALNGDFSLSNDDQTQIIDGLTKYYAEEFKKAQLLTYMQVFENTIGEVGELQILFPNTYQKLKMANPSKFPELGDEYKEIFSQDLKEIIDNLINHIENCKEQELNNLKLIDCKTANNIKKQDYYSSLRLSGDIGSKLIKNYHPVDLFNYLDNQYYYNDQQNTNKQLRNIIHGINLIQSSLLDTTKSQSSRFSNVWLSFEQLNQLNTPSEWSYFGGLIYQKDPDFFKDIFSITPDEKGFSTTEVQLFKIKITAFLSSLIELQDFRSNLNDDNLSDNYIEYMKIVTKVFQTLNEEFYSVDLSKFFKITNYALQIYDNARANKYNNSIHYLSLMFNELPEIDSNSDDFLDVIYTIEKYGSFMSDVINSNDSEELKVIIRNHAAPPASFIHKRDFKRTFSITGQPGYYLAYEAIDSESGFNSGLTMPLGLDLTFKVNPDDVENSSSIGIFFQLVDLGAVLNFRIDDETSTLPDKINFIQIFSPGGSINIGFKNSPVTLGIGYQYTSELRKITIENGNEFYPNGHRVFFRFAWDIPLLNIAKSKN